MLLHQYIRSVQRVVIMGQDINRCSRDSSAIPQKEQADDIVFPISSSVERSLSNIYLVIYIGVLLILYLMLL